MIKYPDYVSLGSEAAVRAAGKMGVEGKEYVVEDGDIMHFLFNVWHRYVRSETILTATRRWNAKEEPAEPTPPLTFQLFIYESPAARYHYPINRDEGCRIAYSPVGASRSIVFQTSMRFSKDNNPGAQNDLSTHT